MPFVHAIYRFLDPFWRELLVAKSKEIILIQVLDLSTHDAKSEVGGNEARFCL
jgi:hypothetical protein